MTKCLKCGKPLKEKTKLNLCSHCLVKGTGDIKNIVIGVTSVASAATAIWKGIKKFRK